MSDKKGCWRAHPHEDMDDECRQMAVLCRRNAGLCRENARLKAALHEAMEWNWLDSDAPERFDPDNLPNGDFYG